MITVALQIILLFGLSTLPTLLYPFYAQEFHLTEVTLTVMYALYVVGTLATLFFFGRLSDIFGRRRIAIISVFLAIAAVGLFMAGGDVVVIAAARVVSGFAAGLSAGTAIAWMRDLHSSDEAGVAAKRSVVLNIFGLGFGPLLAGIVLAFAPHMHTLPYVVFLALLILLLGALSRAPEPSTSSQSFRFSLLKPRIGVPAPLRLAFSVPAITVFVAFSLVGFYSVIAPKVLTDTLGIHTVMLEGLIIFELFLAGMVAVLLGVRLSNRAAMLTGMISVIPAVACIVLAETTGWLGFILIGTALGGCAIGLGYRGSLEVVNQISPVAQRAEVVSSLFVVGNISISIPVIGVGIMATVSSFKIANILFAVVLIVFAVSGVLLARRIDTSGKNVVRG